MNKFPVRSCGERTGRYKVEYEFTVPDPEHAKNLVRKWLLERGGVVLYMNVDFCSSNFGACSFLPANFIAQEDDQMHPAPSRLGDVPSRFKYPQDFICLEQYGGDIERTLGVFTFIKGRGGVI